MKRIGLGAGDSSSFIIDFYYLNASMKILRMDGMAKKKTDAAIS